METLLYFLLWAGIIFLMMRFGCGAHVMGHGSHKQRSDNHENAQPRWIAPLVDTDPVCGMSVQTENAKSVVHDGSVFYFCSQDCREKFEAEPETYLMAPPGSAIAKEHTHG